MKNTNTLIKIISIVLLLITFANGSSYEEELKTWKSYQDLAKWMKSNWSFDTKRQNEATKVIRKTSFRERKNLKLNQMAVTPNKAFENSKGYCGDAVSLITDALNAINPNYKAANVFIYNGRGRPHHWVTGFYVEGKLHIMDYGTGDKFRPMEGTHGPYESLDDYRNFLNRLNIKGFWAQKVYWRE